MDNGYYDEILAVIKKYDPEEYEVLIHGDKVAVENHLDYLAEQFPNIKDFEKAMKETVENDNKGQNLISY